MNKKIMFMTIFFLTLDQISKIIIDGVLKVNEVIRVIPKFFYLTRVNNTGAAFSILEGRTIFLSIISVFAILLLFKYMNEFKQTKLGNVSFSLLLGGILGNLIDRVFLGSVRDFLKFDIFGYEFPVFNIADTCIVVGVLLLIVCVFRGDDKSEVNSRKPRTTA